MLFHMDSSTSVLNVVELMIINRVYGELMESVQVSPTSCFLSFILLKNHLVERTVAPILINRGLWSDHRFL